MRRCENETKNKQLWSWSVYDPKPKPVQQIIDTIVQYVEQDVAQQKHISE